MYYRLALFSLLTHWRSDEVFIKKTFQAIILETWVVLLCGTRSVMILSKPFLSFQVKSSHCKILVSWLRLSWATGIFIHPFLWFFAWVWWLFSFLVTIFQRYFDSFCLSLMIRPGNLLGSWSLFFKDLWTVVEFDDQACWPSSAFFPPLVAQQAWIRRRMQYAARPMLRRKVLSTK